MNQDFVDLLRALSAAEVRFLVVDAYALAIHGRPRATGDLDVWVDPTPQNASRLLAALERFGAPLSEITAGDFEQPGIVFQIGLPPRRIDISPSSPGLHSMKPGAAGSAGPLAMWRWTSSAARPT